VHIIPVMRPLGQLVSSLVLMVFICSRQKRLTAAIGAKSQWVL